VLFIFNFLAGISHNVPVVYDVPAHHIKQTASLQADWNVDEGGKGMGKLKAR
jgi:hypothetical protein